jgi:hypothetical protein
MMMHQESRDRLKELLSLLASHKDQAIGEPAWLPNPVLLRVAS